MKTIENTQHRVVLQVVRDFWFGLCFEPASYNIFKTYYNPIMSWKDKSELFVMTTYELQCRLVRPVMAVTQGSAQKGWRAEEQGSASHMRDKAQGAPRDIRLGHLSSPSAPLTRVQQRSPHGNNLSLFRVPRNRSEITVPQITV